MEKTRSTIKNGLQAVFYCSLFYSFLRCQPAHSGRTGVLASLPTTVFHGLMV